MISFEKEILEQLYRNDFLVLPELGAFIARFEQPKINEETSGIQGPYKTFDFNPLIKEDLNSKFYHILAEKYFKPVKEVEKQYHVFLQSVFSELSENNSFDMSDLGYFELNNSGTIDFKIYKSINFYEDNVSPVKTSGAAKAKINLEEITLSDDYFDTIPNNKKPKSHKALRFILYLLPILILISGLVYILFLKKDPIMDKKNRSAIAESFDSTKLNEPLFDTLNLQTDTVIADLVEVAPKQEKVTKPAEENTEYNYIITVGVFRDKSNINQLKYQLKENGIVAETEKMNKLTKVYVLVRDEQEAQKIVRKIEQLTGDKAVYNKIN
jgi:hypothetical protein